MEFDFSKSDESMLSWAIKIIVAAPNLSIEEVAALKCKVDTAETIEKIREGVQKISKPANAWDHFKTARNSLTKWELAFQKPEKDSKRKRSKNEREALKHTKTSFDVSELPSEQFDFLFVLAYCDIGPFGLEKFRQLYKQCSQYASTGADLRQKIDPYMGNHKTLCRLSSSHGYTKKKRGSSAICSQSHEDQNGSNRSYKRPRQEKPSTPPEPLAYNHNTYSMPLGTELSGDNLMTFHPICYTEEIHNLPNTDYQDLFQANTMLTSCPASNWMEHPSC